LRDIKQRISKWKSLRTKIHTCKPLNANPQSKVCKRVFFPNPRQIKNKNSSPSQKNKTYSTDKQIHTDNKKEALGGNITYTQAGVSCFVGQERGKFKVQFFIGSSVVKIPACV
jgi:chorismate synthase